MNAIENCGDFPGVRMALYLLLQAQGEKGAIISELKCSVCFELYNTTTKAPIENTCGHTLCSGCRSSILNQSTAVRRLAVCPECRTELSTHPRRMNHVLGNIISKVNPI